MADILIEEGSVLRLALAVLLQSGFAQITGLAESRTRLRYFTRRFRQLNTPFRARRNVAVTTISIPVSFLSSLTVTSSTLAPTSRLITVISKRPRSPRSVITREAEPEAWATRNSTSGPGWGGLAMYLARARRRRGNRGHSLRRTVRRIQPAAGGGRGLSRRVKFLLRDYRMSAGNSTASSRWACLNTSRRFTTVPSSTPATSF